MKKFLVIFLSVMLIFVVFPIGTLTASATTSGTTGDCTWSINGTTLTISGNGKMEDYKYSSLLPWGTSITSVVIENGVTSIGHYAFYKCTSLTSINIPNSVTSIGDRAFRECTSLTSITIPDSVMSIGSNAFYYCDSLTSITIPDSVTSIGIGAFENTGYYNNSSNWENGVLYINNHLINAKTSLSGSYTIKQGTKIIAADAFEDCTRLKSISIPDSFTSIGDEAFSGCYSLTSITIPDSVTSIGDL
ncbi:MAG: leucine-rich repeat domain-containing protein, partial [Clostridia bacterium]|nr:leucine-rich repeat domain-containing protein [Clostridia bacterium]